MKIFLALLFAASSSIVSPPYKTDKPMALISEGVFLMGSGPDEKEYGYKLDEARKSLASRRYKWFESEKRRQVNLESYSIDINLVTNKDYFKFVKATGHKVPFVNKKTWDGYHLAHSYKEVKRFLWKNKVFPENRGAHPVVLVDHADAKAYCQWRGLRLASEEEWEKAARGAKGRIFPWGDEFIPENLNSYDAGPYDTVPVGGYEKGKSVYGVYDMAGQVFEWTSTPAEQPGKYIVKGGSWDDYPGVTRAAAHHGRPEKIRHILIGFRCAGNR
ncbi:hypothetical protein MNBD_NITROSPINAE04-524 [hydrothermal vent metagenome]|uniref:Sulfatase-modifying factor enzyme-like domain-containing protein n=1 Tax=hydrothermal vent metagenome TaxID=652676 RepID=A0A3B1C3V7_9ZZZZ